MIRTVIENILLFLLPTLLYSAWVIFTRTKNDTDGSSGDRSAVADVLDGAPYLWLFVTGALLVIVTLAAFGGSATGGKPGQHYQPSILKDGKIQPSHID